MSWEIKLYLGWFDIESGSKWFYQPQSYTNFPSILTSNSTLSKYNNIGKTTSIYIHLREECLIEVTSWGKAIINPNDGEIIFPAWI